MPLPVTRFSALADLTATEKTALQALAGEPVEYPRGATIRAAGKTHPALYLLHRGWAAALADFQNGQRQVFKIHLPGDVMGAPSLPFEHAVETLTTLTAASVSQLSLTALGRLFAEHPRVGALLFLTAQEERVILMDRLTSVGRRSSLQRVSALILHVHERLSLIDSENTSFVELPLTQEQVGDALGLTAVHVNRTLRILGDQGVIGRRDGGVEILRADALRRLADIPARPIARNPTWLPRSR
jgi:CRP/FNR family transcriptional regulator, anaerobic regulatory protein